MRRTTRETPPPSADDDWSLLSKKQRKRASLLAMLQRKRPKPPKQLGLSAGVNIGHPLYPLYFNQDGTRTSQAEYQQARKKLSRRWGTEVPDLWPQRILTLTDVRDGRGRIRFEVAKVKPSKLRNAPKGRPI